MRPRLCDDGIFTRSHLLKNNEPKLDFANYIKKKPVLPVGYWNSTLIRTKPALLRDGQDGGSPSPVSDAVRISGVDLDKYFFLESNEGF